MYKIKLLVSLTLSFFILFSTQASHSQNSKRGVTKNTSTQDSFRFLTFNQIAQLEFSQRTKYVRELRRAVVDIEKVQFMFRDSFFLDAQLPQDQNEKRHLYAYLFGDFANAQASGEAGRGRDATDNCIYAFGISTFKPSPNNERQPFDCEIPAGARCSTPRYNGVRCDPYMSGLSSSADYSCIPNDVRYKSTELCDQARIKLSNENSSLIADTIYKAEQLFGGAVISKSQMTSANAAKIIKDLADYAYDNGAYAELIYVLWLYKKNGVALPINILGEQYKNLEHFEGKLDKFQDVINSVFAKYKNHCDSTLKKEEVDMILDEKWQAKAKEKGRAADIQETRRATAAAKIKALQEQQGKAVDLSKFTVRSVLEIDECKKIDGRRNAIQDKFNQIAETSPQYTDDRPTPKPILPAPIVTNPIRSLGCATNVTYEETQLFQLAARCAVCLAEKAVQKTAAAQTNANEKDRRQNYTVSKKWLSLMSTVALSCGDGILDDSHITTATMLQKVQTFGHCDTDTYEWKIDGSDLTPENKKSIKEWSSRDMWPDKKDKALNPDKDGAFKDIYGISYDQASKIFCDKDKFDTGFFTGKIKGRSNSAKKGEIAKEISDVKAQMSADRDRFLSYTDNSGAKLRNVSNDNPSLFNCMQEAAKMTQDVYGGSSNSCVSFQKFDNSAAHKNNLKKTIDDIVKPGSGEVSNTAVVFDAGVCHVANQYEVKSLEGADKAKDNIGFTRPETVMPNLFAKPDSLWHGGKNPVRMVFPFRVAANDPEETNMSAPGNSYFTTPSTELCSAAATRPSNSKRSTR